MDAVGYGKAHETDHSTRLFYYAVRDPAMAMVMLGGVFSFRQMGMELQQNRVDSWWRSSTSSSG